MKSKSVYPHNKPLYIIKDGKPALRYYRETWETAHGKRWHTLKSSPTGIGKAYADDEVFETAEQALACLKGES